MTEIPSITIITRHSAVCDHRDDPSYKRCDCRRSLRHVDIDPGSKTFGKMKWKKTGQRTWAGAERFKRDYEASFGQPQVEHKRASVRDAVDSFLSQKRGQNLSTQVLKKHERELNRLVEFCERNQLHAMQQIRLQHLSTFRTTWEKDYPSSQTRSAVQGRLREFFKYCMHADLIPKNTAAGLSSIKVDRVPTMPLTKQQYTKMLETIPTVFTDDVKQKRVRGLVQCMRYTGLAICDAVGLPRMSMICDEGKVASVLTSRQKSDTDVYVPIPNDIAVELTAVPNHSPKYFFWNTGVGTVQTAVTHWQHDLRALFRKAGMPDGHPHQLRDTFAVEMLSAGVPIAEVSKMLGHSSIKTTEKHYSPWVKLRQEQLTRLVVASWKAQATVEAGA